MRLLKCLGLFIEFSGERGKSVFSRAMGQHSNQVALGQRTDAYGKFQDRLNLLKGIPQFTGQAGQFQRALNCIQQVLGFIEVF